MSYSGTLYHHKSTVKTYFDRKKFNCRIVVNSNNSDLILEENTEKISYAISFLVISSKFALIRSEVPTIFFIKDISNLFQCFIILLQYNICCIF